MKPTKQCKISQKIYGRTKGGGAVAPPPPPLNTPLSPEFNYVHNSGFSEQAMNWYQQQFTADWRQFCMHVLELN